MKKLLEEFKKFICRGNVLDMAIGVTVATAFTAVVTAFTKAFISPLLALLTDGADMSALKWVIRPEVTDGETVIKEEVSLLYGTFVQSLIDFLIIALVLFFVLKTAAFLNKHAEKLANEVKENMEKIAEGVKDKLGKEIPAETPASEDGDVSATEETKAEAPAPVPSFAASQEEIELLREIRDALIQKKDEDKHE